MIVNFSVKISRKSTIGWDWRATGLRSECRMHPSEAIADMAFAIDAWASFRSVAGAVANALEHVSNNVAKMLTNRKAATGRIMDTDFAMEVAVSSTAQMLMQSSTSMLKQASAVTQMTLSLIS